jgi:hypothetical protein
MKKIIKNYYFLIVICLFIIFIQPKNVFSAEGDLIWVATSAPSRIRISAQGVTVDNTGVYVVGYDDGGNFQWRIEKRALINGILLWATTSDPNPGDNDFAYDVAVDNSGIYVVGFYSDQCCGDFGWRIEKRSTTTGSLIWATTSNLTSFLMDVAYGVAIDNSGIYVVGYDSSGNNDYFRWRIEKRSTTTGSLIWSKVDSLASEAHDVVLGSDGIYVVGLSGYSGKGWRIEKRSTTTGNLIWATTSDQTGSNDTAYGVAVDNTGVYVVGYKAVYDLYREQTDWRIEKRSTTTGSLLWATTNNLDGNDWASGVVISNTGIYVVGDTPGGGRIEKRNITSGALIWEITSNPMGGYGVAIDNTGIYVVGDNLQWRIEKRSISSDIDCGLRIRASTTILRFACEPPGTLTSPLRIRKSSTLTLGIILVNTSSPDASPVRIQTPSGIKAIKLFQ